MLLVPDADRRSRARRMRSHGMTATTLDRDRGRAVGSDDLDHAGVRQHVQRSRRALHGHADVLDHAVLLVQLRAAPLAGFLASRAGWIVGRRQLTVDDIRSGERPRDAAARCAWSVELHDTKELVHWEKFPDNHVYYIPLSCMIPAQADNIVAAGRCVDADSHALSAIRVMGPCIAMGAAAAHALDLAGPRGAVSDVPTAALQERLSFNLQ